MAEVTRRVIVITQRQDDGHPSPNRGLGGLALGSGSSAAGLRDLPRCRARAIALVSSAP